MTPTVAGIRAKAKPKRRWLAMPDTENWTKLLEQLAAQDAPAGERPTVASQIRRALREYLQRRGKLDSD